MGVRQDARQDGVGVRREDQLVVLGVIASTAPTLRVAHIMTQKKMLSSELNGKVAMSCAVYNL